MAATGGPALATAVFDQVGLEGVRADPVWTSEVVGGTSGGIPASAEALKEADGVFTLSGSGDIAPEVPAAADDRGITIDFTLVGVFAGLIAASVVASMFVTAEYRRGLIHTTFAASPRRARVLFAKAIVVSAVTFVAGLTGVAASILLDTRILRSHGASILPSATATEVRIVVGTAALLAVAAMFALAVGTLTRRGSGTVTTVVAVIVLPYLLATTFLPTGAANWLLRFTPAAAFAVEQSVPMYPQVDGDYSPFNGYFPLAPWTGFAVLCAWTATALALAAVVLRRRDA
jgi:ABC-type transport system involved in multi-copper enzyme maturation permease subunit